jgi:Tol biopolymer transport system component
VYASFSSEKKGDINPTISPDGKMLLYCSTFQLKSLGTYFVKKVDNTWSKPKQIDEIINNIRREWDISIARTGTIYFSAFINGGYGGSDIYKSEFINGKYTAPKNLGEKINSENSVSAVYISPDEDYIVFSSDMPGGEGEEDLYVSFLNKDGSWGKGINMGKNINTKETEIWPNVTPDGRYLFYIGVRNGKANIYWVSAKIIEELRPKEGK